MEPELSNGDAILSEVRGLANVVDVRFKAVEVQQADTRDWLARLSSAVERQVEVISRFSGIEARVAQVEARQTDDAIEHAELRDEINALKTANVKRNIIQSILIAAASSVGTALLSGGAAVIGKALSH